jgi:hypothetical protein
VADFDVAESSAFWVTVGGVVGGFGIFLATKTGIWLLVGLLVVILGVGCLVWGILVRVRHWRSIRRTRSDESVPLRAIVVEDPVQLGNNRLVVTSGKPAELGEFHRSEYAVPTRDAIAPIADAALRNGEELPPEDKAWFSGLTVFRVTNRYPEQVTARARIMDVRQRSMLGTTFPLEWYGAGEECLIPPGASDYVIVHRRFEYGNLSAVARPWYSFPNGTLLAVEVWCDKPNSLVRQCFELHTKGAGKEPDFQPVDCEPKPQEVGEQSLPWNYQLIPQDTDALYEADCRRHVDGNVVLILRRRPIGVVGPGPARIWCVLERREVPIATALAILTHPFPDDGRTSVGSQAAEATYVPGTFIDWFALAPGGYFVGWCDEGRATWFARGTLIVS